MEGVKDVCLDGGSSFRLKCFLNNGTPKSKIVGFFLLYVLGDSRCVSRPREFSSGLQFFFCSSLNQFLGERS